MIKYKYSKVYWFFRSLEWMRVYFSPFRFFLPRFYLGRTKIGTPVFYPRKWVKATPERAHKAVEDYIKREENYNKLNPDYARKIRPYDEVFAEKMKYSYAVPLKVGFSFCGLGWKTKYDSIRFEYNPVWSAVCFGYQIALIFRPEHDMRYWESYLFYSKATDKSKSTKERIEEARKEFPCRWRTFTNGVEESICYWDLILRDNYLK